MDSKYICTNLSCAVYVFGASTGGTCPGCSNYCRQVSVSQYESFMEWYERARSRPVT